MYEVFIFQAEFVLKPKLLQDKVSLMKYQHETKVSKLWARPSEYPEKWALKKILKEKEKIRKDYTFFKRIY